MGTHLLDLVTCPLGDDQLARHAALAAQRPASRSSCRCACAPDEGERGHAGRPRSRPAGPPRARSSRSSRAIGLRPPPGALAKSVQEPLHRLRNKRPDGTKPAQDAGAPRRKPVQERIPPSTGGRASNGAQVSTDGGDVSGIRTNAAAELLGVSPNTLRSWERRFSYPKPRRTQGGHRQYDLAELESLRRALLETHNISSAIELARQRGEGRARPAGCWTPGTTSTRVWPTACWRRASPCARSSAPSRRCCCPRSSWPATARAARPSASSPSAGHRLAVRLAPRGAAGEPPAGRAAVRLEPAARPRVAARAGARAGPAPRRLPHAAAGLRPPARAGGARDPRLDPTAFVFCGGEATLEVVGRLVYTVRQVGSAAPVFEYREAMPVTGDHGIPSLGAAPIEAVERLKAYVDSGRIEQVVGCPARRRGGPPRRAGRRERASAPAERTGRPAPVPTFSAGCRSSSAIRSPIARSKRWCARRRPCAAARRRARARGVSAAGFSVLVVLTTAGGGSLELQTLRRRLGWSKANATEVTATLEARGWWSGGARPTAAS